MDILTEMIKLATAIVLLARALLKTGSKSETDGSRDQEDEKGRGAR